MIYRVDYLPENKINPITGKELSEFSDYIMFGGGVTGEIVVSFKLSGFINMDVNVEYHTGARLYFDAKKMAEDGMLVRDGARVKVKGLLPLEIATLLNDAGRFVLSIDKNPSDVIDTGIRKVKIYPDTTEIITKCIKNAGLSLLNQYDTEFATIFVARKDGKNNGL